MEIISEKNKITLLDRLNSRAKMTEDRNNELEDGSIESTQSKQQKIVTHTQQ